MAGFANFVKRDDRWNTEKPYLYHGPAKEGFANTNVVYDEVPLLALRDVRDIEDAQQPSVEANGFAFVQHKSKEIDKVLSEIDSQAYAIEAAQMLKDVLGARLVLPVQTRLRSCSKEEQEIKHRAPAGTEAHIDTTLPDAWSRIKVLLTPEEQEDVLAGKYRARIMNVWRPMLNTAEDFPLAVLDPTSIDFDNDTIAMDQVAPMGAAETLYLKASQEHRWYWKSMMTPDDAIVFTQFDTHPPNGKRNQVGHCAFRNLAAPPDCPPRRSIEARFTVLDLAPYEKEVTLADPKPEETLRQPWREFVQLPKNPPMWKASFERDALKVLEVV